jgi:hypothetical protein
MPGLTVANVGATMAGVAEKTSHSIDIPVFFGDLKWSGAASRRGTQQLFVMECAGRLSGTQIHRLDIRIKCAQKYRVIACCAGQCLFSWTF